MAPSRLGWMAGLGVIGGLFTNNAIVARCILDINIALWDTRTASAPSILLVLFEPHCPLNTLIIHMQSDCAQCIVSDSLVFVWSKCKIAIMCAECPHGIGPDYYD